MGQRQPGSRPAGDKPEATVALPGRRALTSLRHRFVVAGLAAFGISALLAANPEDWSRKGTWDVYLAGGYFFGDTVEYPDYGVEVEIEDSGIGGVGVAYHLSDRWNVGAEMQFGQTDFDSSGADILLNEGTDMGLLLMTVDYHFLNRRFTPFLTGGVGLIVFSDDLPLEYDEGWCFYGDCNAHSDSSLLVRAGAGLRYDPTEYLLLKLTGGAAWAWLDDTDGAATFGFITLSVGASF